MNLSEPLDGLTTEVGAAVLRVLARTDTGFSGRQVHALAQVGSTSSVHRALQNLVRVGIVACEARPPSIIYRANRAHILWPVVELALSARQRVFDSVAQLCSELVPDEVPELERIAVVVYGSVARRDSSLESDVDLCVVFPDGFDDDARADIGFQLAAHVERITGNPAQVVPLDRSEVTQRIADRDPFLSNVLSDGVLVYGQPLRPAGRRAA